MQLKEVMTRNVETVPPSATIADVAQRMRGTDCGVMPVCENDRLVGIVTDRDIVLRAIAEGKDPARTQVRECMSKGVTFCFEDQGVEEAARVMESQQIRRIVILNRKKRLIGILSLGDLAIRIPSEGFAGRVLEQISEHRHEMAA